MNEIEKEALYTRLNAIEERVNELQRLLNSVATTRALSGIRTLLEERINVLTSSITSIVSDINTIKTKLNGR